MFQKIQRLTAAAAMLFLPSSGYSAHPSPNAENAPLIGPGKYKDFRLEKPSDSTKQGENWMRYAPSKDACGFDRLEFKIRSGEFGKVQILDKNLRIIKTASVVNPGRFALDNLALPANPDSEYFIKIVGKYRGDWHIREPTHYDFSYSTEKNCNLKKLSYLNELKEESISSVDNTGLIFNLKPRTSLWFHQEVGTPYLKLEGFYVHTYSEPETDDPFNIEIVSEAGKVIARKLVTNPSKDRSFDIFLAKSGEGYENVYIRYSSYSDKSIPVRPMYFEPLFEEHLSSEELQNLKRCGKITACPTKSPLVIDFHNNSVSMSGPSGAVYFDLKGDGKKNWYNWLTAGTDDSFIALDLNQNGAVDDGKELFGIGTVLIDEGIRALNGFIALDQYDKPHLGGNNDWVLDQKDKVFSQLLLWNDSNADAISQTNELSLLRDKVSSIDLWPIHLPTTDSNGNRIDLHSTVKGQRNQSLPLKDVDFSQY